MQLTIDHAMQQIAAAVADAKARLGHEEFNIETWQQDWADATCGFGGGGGQAITTAQTVIVMDWGRCYGQVHVYHRGKYAYVVASPNRHFWECASEHRLPGAGELQHIRELENHPQS